MARKAPGYYKLAWKAIRADVTFEIDVRKELTNAQKGMITRYHKQILSQTQFRPTFRYSTRSTRNLKAVKKYTGQEGGFPRLRVAYIPIPNDSGKPAVTVSKSGKVKVVTNSGGAGEIQRVGYLFGEHGSVVTDTANVVKSILKEDAGASDAFRMMCGKNESSSSVTKEFVLEKVQFYLNEYDNADQWFFGVIGYSFSGQANFSEYLKQRKEKPRKPRGKRNG